MKTKISSIGFTLVEVMIVVAIIALLAAIAVPNFLRARERGQATTILNDARLLDGAVDQYALEQNKAGSEPAAFSLVSSYLKTNSRLAASNGKDIFNADYLVGPTVGDGAKIHTSSKAAFDSNIVPTTFWAGY